MKVQMMAACALALGVAGCAKKPESIAASYISDIPYQSYTCQQIGQEMVRVDSALSASSAQQNKARTNDTVGVIFLGLPVSSLSGDNVAAEIARLKGEKDALHRAGLIKNCSLPPPPAPTTKAKPVS
jgi:hypothetical protein